MADLPASDTDAVLTALAIASLERPAWYEYLRGVAFRIAGEDGRTLFDAQRRLHLDDHHPPGPRPRPRSTP